MVSFPILTRRFSLAATAAMCALAAATVLTPTDRSRAADLGDFRLEAMIGQMIMVGFVGTRTSDPWPRKLVGQIDAGHVGGVLFLKRNVAGRDSVGALNAAFLAAGGAKPVLLAIDQEVGSSSG